MNVFAGNWTASDQARRAGPQPETAERTSVQLEAEVPAKEDGDESAEDVEAGEEERDAKQGRTWGKLIFDIIWV